MKSITTTEEVAFRELSIVLMAAARTPEMTTPATPAHHGLLFKSGRNSNHNSSNNNNNNKKTAFQLVMS